MLGSQQRPEQVLPEPTQLPDEHDPVLHRPQSMQELPSVLRVQPRLSGVSELPHEPLEHA